ncbi:MAG TPA: phosphoenolpyruvate--protein phosphotransferase [Ktedonobacteraceae bacterium]|nr:phosphoenolpyruvate--protein phosphotransferase [Ktedonobacteraceae bacterium]
MKILRGIAASPGIASGAAQTIRPLPSVNIMEQRTVEAEVETARIERAIAQAITHLDKLLSAAHGPVTAILGAQLEMLDDPELKQGADALIASGSSAEAAVTRVADEYAEQLASLSDAYLAARAEDVREAGRRIVAELLGISLEVHLERAAILVARDLSPADMIGLNPAFLQAIVTESGSATGHLAIVAQGLGIPAVVGVADALAAISDHTHLIVDGEKGEVMVSPDEVSRREVEARLEAAQHERQDLEVYRERQGMTADGVHIEVFANIGSVAEAHKAVEMGAEGVGLFRTELLAAQGLPPEEEQYAIYQEVAAVLRRPLIVRTFDIGGDKPVPGLDIPAEANPFLGWRGIRLALDRPEEVFLPQVRAILRAAANYDLRMMLPMVATPEEVSAARSLIEQAIQDLQSSGYPAHPIPVGIMVETPAAALTLDHFRGLIGFASIGTNDLVQYTYAVDRTNAHVRERAKPSGAATLRLIAQVCRAGVPVAVCGQLAGDAEAVPLLVGLGVRELSVAPARIPTIKKLLSTLTLSEMLDRAKRAIEETV